MPSATVSINAIDLMKMSTSILANVDYTRMYEIADTVSKNPSLITDFDKDPEAAAKKINGFSVPPGFHMHIVDSNNIYHPKEDDALSQISTKSSGATWSRIEARAGVSTMACIICLWCS